MRVYGRPNTRTRRAVARQVNVCTAKTRWSIILLGTKTKWTRKGKAVTTEDRQHSTSTSTVSTWYSGTSTYVGNDSTYMFDFVVNTDGGDKIGGESVGRKTEDQACLPHRTVPYRQHFDTVVGFLRRHLIFLSLYLYCTCRIRYKYRYSTCTRTSTLLVRYDNCTGTRTTSI